MSTTPTPPLRHSCTIYWRRDDPQAIADFDRVPRPRCVVNVPGADRFPSKESSYSLKLASLRREAPAIADRVVTWLEESEAARLVQLADPR